MNTRFNMQDMSIALPSFQELKNYLLAKKSFRFAPYRVYGKQKQTNIPVEQRIKWEYFTEYHVDECPYCNGMLEDLNTQPDEELHYAQEEDNNLYEGTDKVEDQDTTQEPESIEAPGYFPGSLPDSKNISRVLNRGQVSKEKDALKNSRYSFAEDVAVKNDEPPVGKSDHSDESINAPEPTLLTPERGSKDIALPFNHNNIPSPDYRTDMLIFYRGLKRVCRKLNFD